MGLIQITLQDLFDLAKENKALSIATQRDFFTSIFSDNICGFFRKGDASFWSKCFKLGPQVKKADGVYTYLCELKDPGSGKPCTYSTSEERRILEENWRTILANAGEDLDPIRTAALNIVKEASQGAAQPGTKRGTWQDEEDNCFFFHRRISRLEEPWRPIEEVLACLSLIAVTSPYSPWTSRWADVVTPEQKREEAEKEEKSPAKRKVKEEAEAQDQRFYDLVLPPLPGSGDYAEELKIGIYLLQQRELSAEEHLTEATKSADNTIAGNAYFYRYLYWKNRGDEASAAADLGNAKKLGNPDAIAALDDQTGKNLQTTIETYERHKGDWEKGKRLMDSCFAALAKNGKPETRALAAWTIYELVSEPSLLPIDPDGKALSLPAGETPDAFLKLAHDLGCEKARSAWEEQEAKKEAGITHSCVGAVDLQQCGGAYRVTGPEELVAMIKKTAPETWHECEQLPSGDVTAKQTKYLFFSDDQEENLSKALAVMEELRKQAPAKDAFENRIYIRGNSEELQTLVDTAVNRMGKAMTAVAVLDDDKWAAQDLLFHHPLFFPVRSLANDRRATLHFVIVGGERTAQWLLREAFCVMGFRKKDNAQEIACEITVLAPDAGTVKSRVEYACPGLMDGATSKDLVPHSKIIYQTIPAYDSPEFDAAVRTILRSDCCYPYFAVCAGGDTENLRIATKIRELQIRDVIAPVHASDVSLPALNALPPIAFHCRNDDIAHLSRQLVAYNETCGDQWFNNWSLIPFGARSDRYAWDNLDGLLDQLAWAFHRQYAGAETPESKAQSDYYAWGYNQDSSRGAAASLPYRLFQFRCKDNAQFFSPAWQITDRAYFATPGQLEALGKRLLACVDLGDEAEIEAMAQWEHDRFIRWMLAHGWLPDSPQQAAAFYHAGNHRQQLFIARMHPCICGYDDLGALSAHLKRECGMDKDFYKLDLSSIQNTPYILGVERELRQKREKEEERDDH